MRTFIADIFPKIQRFSQKLDSITLLTNQHWVSIDNIVSNKTVYIFRENSELLISTNGKVEKAKWEYLGNKSLLIEKKEEIYLFKHSFFDQNILALKVDSSNEYAVFVNENKYNGDLNSIEKVFDFLKQKYLDTEFRKQMMGASEYNSLKNEHEALKAKTPEQIEKEKKIRLINLFVVIGVMLIFLIFIAAMII